MQRRPKLRRPSETYLLIHGMAGIPGPGHVCMIGTAKQARTSTTSTPARQIPLYGIPHGGELPYVFGNFRSEPRTEDVAVSRLIRRYWISFATRGDPNGPGLPTWPTLN